MTAPVELALIGKVKFAEIQKEVLLKFWQDVMHKTDLQVAFQERMEAVERVDDHFVVRTNCASYRAQTVLLSMGRRGSPRKLEVPGEETAKVAYRLVDPAQYQGQSVLVVGGGDSALEAAIALADVADTTVTLSYRSEAFSRVKQKNRQALLDRQQRGRIQVRLSSQVTEITDTQVALKTADGTERLPNDAVIVCAGGLLPTPLLQKMGIQFSTKHGQA